MSDELLVGTLVVNASALDSYLEQFASRDDADIRISSTLTQGGGTVRAIQRIATSPSAGVDDSPHAVAWATLPTPGNDTLGPTQRVISVGAYGVPRSLGTSVVEALEIPDGLIDPWLEAPRPFAAGTSGDLNLSQLQRWLSGRLGGPLILALPPTAAAHADAQRVYASAIPSFIRPAVPLVILDSAARQALRSIAREDSDETWDVIARALVPEKFVVLHHTSGWVPPYVVVAGSVVIARKNGPRLASIFRAAVVAGPLPRPMDWQAQALIASGGKTAVPVLASASLVPAVDVIAKLEADFKEREAALVADNARLRNKIAKFDAYQRPADEPEEPRKRQLRARPEVATVDADAGVVDLVLPCPLAGTPTTFPNLFAQAREVFVHLTLSPELEEQSSELIGAHAKAQTWVARTAAILGALEGYAASRAVGAPVRTFRGYMEALDNPPFPPRQVTPSESQTTSTNRKTVAERTFTVPTDVDPSGWALFTEHVRVDSGGRGKAPRLYYLDIPRSGKVIVGYVGAHLRNKSTN